MTAEDSNQQKHSGHRSYDIAFDFDSGPIGLHFETCWYGRQVVVRGFENPIGSIRIGDVLTDINGQDVLELGFKATMQMLRQIGGGGRHVLHFMSPQALEELKRTNSDVLAARKYIHANKKRFYTPTSPSLIYGTVERNRGPSITSFNLYHEETGEFLLACSCKSDMTGSFIFHRLQDAHLREFKELVVMNQDNSVYLGWMKSNFLGTEFSVHDHRGDVHDLGLIVYDTNVLGGVPNVLKVILPQEKFEAAKLMDRYRVLQQTRVTAPFLDRLRSWKDEMPYGAVEQQDQADLVKLTTKKPIWNDKIAAWTLKFNGRATRPSKKNFVLELEDETICLRFGKRSKSRFALDFKAPLSSTMALAVACTAFAAKKAVT